jgi:bifunctional oligoribonuclease and PAP phosphatase NrnA
MSLTSAPAAQVAQLAELLASTKRIAIVSHFNPDGDAVGSSLGLCHVLKSLGHTVQVVLPNLPPPNLHWMPGYTEVLTFDKAPNEALVAIQAADILFCLDFNQPDRVAGLEQALRAASVKVLIDHHQEPDTFAQIMFSDTSACATCQMVYDIVVALGHSDKVDRAAATCLYAGIVTDSGSFRYRSTTAHTMRVGADLIERGVEVDTVQNSIMDGNSVDRLKLLGFTLSERMTVMPELGTALIWLSREDLKRFNFQPGDTEGIVNYGLSIRGVRVAAFFIERADQVKVSMRSKATLPVNGFLKEHFNGGGHANAAGGQTTESLYDALARFRALLPAFIQAHPEA